MGYIFSGSHVYIALVSRLSFADAMTTHCRRRRLGPSDKVPAGKPQTSRFTWVVALASPLVPALASRSTESSPGHVSLGFCFMRA